jgi:hypothetical protein
LSISRYGNRQCSTPEQFTALSKEDLAHWARLMDGASEVHKMVLARFYMDERNDFWTWS